MSPEDRARYDAEWAHLGEIGRWGIRWRMMTPLIWMSLLAFAGGVLVGVGLAQ